MTSHDGGAKVGALNVGKSKGRKNNDSVGEDSSRLRMRLKFLFSCMTFRIRAKGTSSDNNKQDDELVDPQHQVEHAGSSSSKDGGQDERVPTTLSSTSTNSVIVAQFIITPNLSPELRAYPHLRNFSYSDLRLATRNFKREHFLGEGGFGRVFKGWLSEDEMSPTTPGVGMPVAVKTLNHDGFQGHKEWLAEVNYLGQLQHPNLVKLVGFCNEGDQRILVYEYMSRGSLDSHLFTRMNAPLSWSTRMRIMLDAAKGLAYLHQSDNKIAVIYRDFKTSNVLLDWDTHFITIGYDGLVEKVGVTIISNGDREYNAKLSDFGLAKDGPVGDNTHVSTRVMGTQGYAAPEYVMTGRLSAKSDVYSFGVVLLEMITGRKAMDRLKPRGETQLVKWAVPKIRTGGKYCHMVLVDPRLQGHYSIKGSVRALSLAAQCVQNNASARPAMSKVVQVMRRLPLMLEDMAFEAPSPTHVMIVGPSHSSNIGGHKHGLRVGSSTRNVPKPRPNCGRP